MYLDFMLFWLLSGLGFVDPSSCTEGPLVRRGDFMAPSYVCEVHGMPSPSRRRR